MIVTPDGVCRFRLRSRLRDKLLAAGEAGVRARFPNFCHTFLLSRFRLREPVEVSGHRPDSDCKSPSLDDERDLGMAQRSDILELCI